MKNNKPLKMVISGLFAFAAAHSCWAEEVPGKDANHFDVMEFRVAGNTVLPAQAIEEAVYPFLGEGRTVEDVERARDSLEKTYHDAGYLTVLVDIPEQQVDGGLVKLQVTEGKVARTRVVGSRYFSLGRIREKIPELAEGNVPYFPEVQKGVAAVNTTPDRRVTPVLRPGKTPGTVEVDLKVEDHAPLHGSLELNNHHSANTASWRTSGMLRYDNLWQREHSLSLQYQTAPEEPSQVKVLSASYVVPLSARGDALALYAVRSRSDVAVVDTLSVLGNADIIGARRILPLPAQSGLTHSLTLGADYKSFKESLLLGADSFKTPISYMPFSAAYSFTLQDPDAFTQANISANFALRGLGNRTEEFARKRYLAQPNYFYLKGEVTQSRKLFSDYTLSAKIGGQLANMPLISNEQFSAGGADSVRGYLESEAMGDDALSAGVELRTPSLAKNLPDSINDLQLLAFTEGAHLRVKDTLPSQQARYTLSSAGIGMRLRAFDQMTSSLDVGWPLHATGNTPARHPRVHFKLVYDF